MYYSNHANCMQHIYFCMRVQRNPWWVGKVVCSWLWYWESYTANQIQTILWWTVCTRACITTRCMGLYQSLSKPWKSYFKSPRNNGLNMVQPKCNITLACTGWFAHDWIIAEKRGVALISPTITSTSAISESKMGATPLYSTMTQSRANWLVRASATLCLGCTIVLELANGWSYMY